MAAGVGRIGVLTTPEVASAQLYILSPQRDSQRILWAYSRSSACIGFILNREPTLEQLSILIIYEVEMITIFKIYMKITVMVIRNIS